MSKWNEIPTNEEIEKTIEALNANGIKARLVKNKEEAKEIVLNMIPKGSSVMTMASQTALEAGITAAIDEGEEYKSIRKELMSMDKPEQALERRQLGSAPDYAISSVHAVTQDGHLLAASASGSQLPAMAYGANHYIFVVGVQKIVKDINDGIKRIYEYTLPLENERMMKAYNVQSSVRKILIINQASMAQDLELVFINEDIGY